MNRIALMSAAILICTAGMAFAQDGANPSWEAAPLYGTVELTNGFTPDPHQTVLTAGGSDQVQIPGCAGFIAAGQPDVDLNYVAGSWPLHIYVESEVDTTLVVFGPDMVWYCNDDSALPNLQPHLVWATPPAGNYNIWVGVWGDAGTASATLNISELDPTGGM